MPSDPSGDAVTGALPPHLSMVVLHARDLPALRRFYLELGWPERPGASDSLAMFDLGAAVLTLHPAAPGAVPPCDEAAAVAPTLVVNVASADAVDRAVAQAAAAGAGVVSPARDQTWGGRSAVVADPEGNRWEVLFVPRA